MIKSLKYVMPYHSIHFRVPDYWREEGETSAEFYYYHDTKTKGGPLRVRREDFNLESAELDVFGGREFSGAGDGRTVMERFIDSFERLEASFVGSDVLHRAMEILEPQEDGAPEERLFTYRKLELSDGGDNVIWGWVRGRPMGEDSFCVVSFLYQAPRSEENSDDIAEVVGMIDREVRRASVHALADVERAAKDAVRRHLLEAGGQPAGEAGPINGGRG